MSAAALQAPKTTAAAPLRRRPAAPEILRPPGTATPQPMGNQAALRTRSGGILQAKLTVNQPNDPYEQEADRIADQVMRMPDPTLQRKCACDGGCPKCKAGETQESPIRLQAKASGTPFPGHAEAPGIVHQVLQSPGQPLDPATRAFMEPRFGIGLSDIRIHTDATAAASAHAVEAVAYAVGKDIVFASGEYAPNEPSGRHLLAHEITHVIQQSAVSGVSKISEISYSGHAPKRDLDFTQSIIRRGGASSIATETRSPAEVMLHRVRAPNNDCQGTPNRVQHNLEHRLIQEDFLKKNRNGVKEYQIPNSSSRGNTGWADLADPVKKFLFEIKPWWRVLSGYGEALSYLAGANASCGSGWSLGTTNDYPLTVLTPPNNPKMVVIAAVFLDGVIVYASFEKPDGNPPDEMARRKKLKRQAPGQEPEKPNVIPFPGRPEPGREPEADPDDVAASVALSELMVFTFRIGLTEFSGTITEAKQRIDGHYRELKRKVDYYQGRHEIEQKRSAELGLINAVGYLVQLTHNVSLPSASIWWKPVNLLKLVEARLQAGDIPRAVEAIADAGNAFLECKKQLDSYLYGVEEAGVRAQMEIPSIAIGIVAAVGLPQAVGKVSPAAVGLLEAVGEVSLAAARAIRPPRFAIP